MVKEANFKKLKAWQAAKDLAVHIYRISEKGKLSKDYSLRDQIRKAAVSIVSNIAEGDERGSNKDSVRFFYISRASCAEVLTQAIISCEIGYITNEELIYIENEASHISSMLYKLISVRCKSGANP